MYLSELLMVLNSDTEVKLVNSDTQLEIAHLCDPYDLCNSSVSEDVEVMDVVAEQGMVIVDIDFSGKIIFEEYSEPDWYFESLPFEEVYPDVSFISDRDYPHSELYERVRNLIECECITYELEDGYWNTGTEFFNYYVPKDTAWTREEVKKAISYAKEMDDYDAIMSIMGLADGHEYKKRVIRGCMQRDWAEIIYPSDVYDNKGIDVLQDLFFGLATEWRNLNLGIGGYYTSSWDVDSIKEELAECEGVDVDCIVLRRITDRKYHTFCDCNYEMV